MADQSPYDFNKAQAQREEIYHQLRKDILRTRKIGGRLLSDEDIARLQEAMSSIETICVLLREGLFEQVYSVRVKRILMEFEGLAHLVKGQEGRRTKNTPQERARIRVKSWSHEARRWMGDLPLLAVVRRFPDEIQAKLKASWLQAGGAYFTPPPRLPGAMPEGTPARFQVASLCFFFEWEMDPMDQLDESGSPKWPWNSEALLDLLAFAREALLLEVGGTDRGGNTSFARRRQIAPLRDAFVFSCLRVYERTLGPGTARQSANGPQEGTSMKAFDRFVLMVQKLAVGGEVPHAWRLGPNPIRNAIGTQRALQRLFKAAGVDTGEAFYALPEERQEAALARLSASQQRRLQPSAPPWV